MNFKETFQHLKNALTGGSEAELPKSPDGFPLDPASPHFNAHCLISEFLAEIPNLEHVRNINPGQYQSAKKILALAPADQITAVEALLLRRAKIALRENAWSFSGPFPVLRKLTSLLLRRNLPYTAEQAAKLVSILCEGPTRHCYYSDLPAVLKVCEKLKAQGAMSPELEAALKKLKAELKPYTRWGDDATRRRARDIIDRLVGERSVEALDPFDAWAVEISNYLTKLEGQPRSAWAELIVHARTATQTRASAKWLKEAERLVSQVGRAEFTAKVAEWFPLVRPSAEPDRLYANPGVPMNERNADVLKGLVLCSSQIDDERAVRAVSDLAQVCFKKIPGWGQFSAKVGNACLFSLSELPGLAPVAQLSRLKLKVKYAVALRLIDTALQEAATRLGMTSEELEEIAVPTYGLNEHGILREEFGDWIAEVKITGTHDTELAWIKQDGKTQKSTPAEIKEPFADDLKELKRSVQDIEKMLPAQRDRIERLLLSERQWEFGKWRERYLDHPLLRQIARRLIWHFQSGKCEVLGIWHAENLIDVEDRPIDWLTNETQVRLWHPLGCAVETVAAWRHWLESHQVTQPFKQAHREIYVLTDAEITTDTYSNRFAGHIIRQHQFAALARQRGWQYTLQGNFDSHNTPTLSLPRWDLTAEFWVDGAGDNESTSDSGIFLHLSTDQVRFRDAAGPRRLAEVPALLFSEVMRDVDLFVGVCSIGNDPTWQDRGDTGRYGPYWQVFSFGELSASAQTRREVLERLVPRLKIASRCSFDKKSLIVRGDLRTYKIHLGSANIMMEPNDQYLCIVPDRGGAAARGEPVFLPFEGDSTLAVILSKAFMLANDSKIKDPTIVRQIQR